MLSVEDGTGRRTVWAVVFTMLVVTGTVGVTTAAPAMVTISDMSVSDHEPTVGDTIIVTPTVRHSGSGTGSFEVTEVTLRDSNWNRVDTADNVGTLGAGDTVDVPLRTTVESAGEKQLVVHVRGKTYGPDGDLDGLLHLERPVHVSVSEPSTSTETKPQLNLMTGDLTAGVESDVRVAVSNGDDEELNNLSVHLSGPATAETQEKLRPALGAHNSTTVEFDVRPPSAGTQQINATLHYGSGNSVAVSESVEVRPVRDEVTVYATLEERNGTAVLQYRVSNNGNAALSNVALSGAAVDEPFPSTVIGTVPAGESVTATVDLNDRPSGPATISAVYEVGSTTGQTDQTVQFTDSLDNGSAQNGMSTTSVDANQSQSGLLPFGSLALFVTGLVVGGAAFGYRSWRHNGKP